MNIECHNRTYLCGLILVLLVSSASHHVQCFSISSISRVRNDMKNSNSFHIRTLHNNNNNNNKNPSKYSLPSINGIIPNWKKTKRNGSSLSRMTRLMMAFDINQNNANTYLDSLSSSQAASRIAQMNHNFASTDYLNTLSQVNMHHYDVSPEDFLSYLSTQLADVAAAAAAAATTSVNLVTDGDGSTTLENSFNLAAEQQINNYYNSWDDDSTYTTLDNLHYDNPMESNIDNTGMYTSSSSYVTQTTTSTPPILDESIDFGTDESVIFDLNKETNQYMDSWNMNAAPTSQYSSVDSMLNIDSISVDFDNTGEDFYVDTPYDIDSLNTPVSDYNLDNLQSESYTDMTTTNSYQEIPSDTITDMPTSSGMGEINYESLTNTATDTYPVDTLQTQNDVFSTFGTDNNNNPVQDMTDTVTSTITDMSDSLTSKLADMSYDSMVDFSNVGSALKKSGTNKISQFGSSSQPNDIPTTPQETSVNIDDISNDNNPLQEIIDAATSSINQFVSSNVDNIPTPQETSANIDEISNNPVQEMIDATTSSINDITEPLTSTDVNNNPIQDIYESATTSMDDITESLSSKIADMSYDSMVDISNAAQKMTVAATRNGGNKFSQLAIKSSASLKDAVSSAKEASSAKMSTLFNQMAYNAQEIPDRLYDAGESSVNFLGKAANYGASEISHKGTESAEALKYAIEAEKSSIVTGTNSAVHNLGQQSLTDVAHGVIDGMQFMANLLITIIDAIMTKVGTNTSVNQILQNAKSSVYSLIDGASHSVTQTISDKINDIGSLTVFDVLSNLTRLLIAVSEILLVVLNAVIKILSGREATEWALMATTSIKDEANHLTSQTVSTANDITHRSLTELTASIGDFSHHVGDELFALVQTLNDSGAVTDDSIAVAGSSMDAIVTAIQTAVQM